jgi:Tol biopolymer transport system component
MTGRRVASVAVLVALAVPTVPAGAAGPTAAGLEGRIAFVATPTGCACETDVVTVEPDGSDRAAVGIGEDYELWPQWSPDGTKILYWGGGAGADLRVVDADGTDKTRLTRDMPMGGGAFGGAWSPSGRAVAFAYGEDHGTVDYDIASAIFVARADGSRRRRITGARHAALSPSWSPDGRRIAYTSDARGGYDVYVVDRNGTNRTRLTDSRNGSGGSSPEWSPDGEQILFSRDGDIWVMDSDGTSDARLTHGGAFGFSYSPDGSRVVFVALNADDRRYHLYVMNSDGSGMARITEDEADHQDPVWSPTGEHVAYTRFVSAERDSDVFVVAADGSGARAITDAPDRELAPSWQAVHQ